VATDDQALWDISLRLDGAETISAMSLTLTLSSEHHSAQTSTITNDGRLNPVWHTMLYSCTHMATVGVKGLR